MEYVAYARGWQCDPSAGLLIAGALLS